MHNPGQPCLSVRTLAFAILFSLTPTVLAAPCPCDDPKWCEPVKTIPKKEVFIFSSSDSPDVWMKYNWSDVTTIVRFAKVTPELLCFAHKKGVRVSYLVTFSKEALLNATARQVWVKQQTQFVQDYFLDGLNLDFEKVIFQWEKEYSDGLVAITQEIRDSLRKLNPYAQITFDAPNAPNLWERYYDYSALAKYIDFFILMCYDELAHILTGGPDAPYSFTKQGVQAFLQLPNVSPSKLVLAVPWYGYDFVCDKIIGNEVCIEFKKESPHLIERSNSVTKINDGVQVSYEAIVKLLKNSTTGRRWDEASQTPYFNYKNPKDNKIHQVWYDDPQSLMLKINLVKEFNLRGAGMWYTDLIDYSSNTQADEQRRQMWGVFAQIRS